MTPDQTSEAFDSNVLIAYISESQDRENNTLYIASICNKEKNEIFEELSDYDREELEKSLNKMFPEIEIENA